MKIVNLTPHILTLVGPDGSRTELPSEGCARCDVERRSLGTLAGWPLSRTEFGRVQGMPEPSDGTVYVVSAIVANALKAQGRTDDVVIVDDTVRDGQGRIVGCRGFAKV